MFQPSEKTAELVREASKTLTLEMHARAAASSGEISLPPEYFDVRAVIGEQVVGTLALVARRHAAVEPESRLPVIGAESLQPEIEIPLVKYLSLDRNRKSFRPALQALAAELWEWAKRQPSEAARIGLGFDSMGRLQLACVPIKPVLKPLE